jgi:hypothetical protein
MFRRNLQVLEALLAFAAGLPRRDHIRYVAFDRDPLAPALVKDRVITLAVESTVNFDEICAVFLLSIHRASPLSRVLHRDGDVRPHGRVAIDEGTSQINVWSNDVPGCEFAAKLVRVQRPGHFPYSRHTICDI